MKIKPFFVFTALWIILVAPIMGRAQATKWQDITNRKGIREGYNKYEDETIVMTNRMVVTGAVGKGNFLDPSANQRTMEMVAAFVHSGQKMSKPVTEVMFAIMPKASTTLGKLTQRLENDGDKGSFYISPNSKLIVIADDERFDLGTVSKSETLNVWGNYEGNAYVAIPVETFRKIVTAKKVEMAVGNIEIKLAKRNTERLHSLLDELDARMKQVSLERKIFKRHGLNQSYVALDSSPAISASSACASLLPSPKMMLSSSANVLLNKSSGISP